MSKKILHLGSGGMVIQGAINTDFDEMPGVDMVLDASKVPYPFDDDTLDEIINSHMIEHIEFEYLFPMLEEWKRILKPGGTVRLDCPDFNEAVKLYEKGEIKRAIDCIFGNNERPTQHHRAGYTPTILKEFMLASGFSKVEEVPSDDYHIACGIPTFRLIATK